MKPAQHAPLMVIDNEPDGIAICDWVGVNDSRQLAVMDLVTQGYDEALALANLFAAARELLAALKEARVALPASAMIDDAIAKAERGQS